MTDRFGNPFPRPSWFDKYERKSADATSEGCAASSEIDDKKREIMADVNERAGQPEIKKNATELCDRVGVVPTAVEDSQPIQVAITVTAPWPDPISLEGYGTIVQPFNSEAMLPQPLRKFVVDVARRLQVPVDMPAVATVCAVAGAAGRGVRVQPKQKDTSWTKPGNLWGGIVGPPGSKKSAVMKICFGPLYKIEAEEQAKYASSFCDADLENKQFDNDKEVHLSPEKPRLLTNDSTHEALHAMMGPNPRGLIVLRDELTGLIESSQKAGREGERAFYLEAWNGDNFFTIDRIGRGTVTAICCLSLFGGIQPKKLEKYIKKWLVSGDGNDGFLERFQLLISPDMMPDFEYIDELPDFAVEEEITRLYRSIVSLSPENPILFRFSADAQMLYQDWWSVNQRKIRAPETHSLLQGILSKQEGLLPTLGCLFALSDFKSDVAPECMIDGQGEIQWRHAQQALYWCQYLESHAKRIYSDVITSGFHPAKVLSRHILAGKIGTIFTVRDIKQHEWSGLKEDSDIDSALSVLIDRKWIRSEDAHSTPFGGRPTTRYEVNPKATQLFPLVN